MTSPLEEWLRNYERKMDSHRNNWLNNPFLFPCEKIGYGIDLSSKPSHIVISVGGQRASKNSIYGKWIGKPSGLTIKSDISRLVKGIVYDPIVLDEMKPMPYEYQTQIPMKPKETNMSFFPTAGTRTHWKTRDGRSIHVNDLALPHLANIMIQLWDMASKEILKNASQYAVGKLESDTSRFLEDNCFTFNNLRFRAFNLGFVDTLGRIKNKCRETTGQNEPPKSPAKAPFLQIADQMMSIHFSDSEAVFLINRIMERTKS